MVGLRLEATNASNDVRTGVAQGLATSADEPPSRNVRRREDADDVCAEDSSVGVTVAGARLPSSSKQISDPILSPTPSAAIAA